MNQSVDREFSKLRSFIWPIYRHELRMLLPMVFILFFVCFNYSILRSLKDSIVITASGAEVIPFIKLWVMLPAAIISTLVFTKLSNRFSQEKVFYIIISVFSCGYLLFAFVLYPLRETLHPHGLADTLQGILPAGFKGLVSMLCHWTFTLFYVLCELWTTIVMSVLFWGFANEVTKIQVARRFYSVFSIFSNLAAIAAGQAANFVSLGDEFNPSIPFGSSSWEQTMMVLVLVITVTSIAIMAMFRWMNKNVLNDPSFDEFHKSKLELKKSKRKSSIKDSFSYLSNSKYLICIAVLVVAYNLTINLAEVVWKDRLRAQFKSPTEVNQFLNNLTSIMGIVSTMVSIFMAQIIARFGWTKTALITPVMMLITCGGFFTFMIFQEHLADYAVLMTGLTPLAIAVYFGAAQNCLSKAMKYSVFDATKEITFIPLSHESKLKGKAAIDGIGSRLGKSGGSLLHQGLLLIFGSLSSSAPYVAVIIMGSITGWIIAVKSLGRMFAEKVSGEKTDLISEGAKEEKPPAVANA